MSNLNIRNHIKIGTPISDFIRTGIRSKRGSFNVLEDGAVGKGYLFNGTDQYVDMGELDTNIVSDGKLSITGRFYYGGSQTGTEMLLSGIDIIANDYFHLAKTVGSDKLTFYNKIGVSTSQCETSDMIPNTWYFFAISIDGTSRNITLNGITDNFSGKLDMSTYSNPLILNIGARNGFVLNKNKMFDVKFFNKALTSDEISEIYNREYASYINRIINGTFNTSSDWNLNDGASIGGGILTVDGSQSSEQSLSQISNNGESGYRFRIKFDITKTAGGMYAVFGSLSFSGSLVTGSYDIVTDVTLSANSLVFFYNADFEGTIDNVEIYKISEDVTFDTSLLYRDCEAWYKMNETTGTVMYDSTKNYNDGTIVNPTPQFFTTHWEGYYPWLAPGNSPCYDFNGTDQRVFVGELSTNIVADGKFSISTWVSPNSLPFSAWASPWSLFKDDDNKMYIQFVDGESTLRLYGEANNVSRSTVKYTLSNIDMANIFIVVDGTSWKIYINGNLEINDSSGIDMSTFVGIPSFYMGSVVTYANFLTGKQFDAKFFNHALSADEVAEEYDRLYASYIDKVINGTFDTDTDWTYGIGWSIGGGTASCDGSQPTTSNLQQVVSSGLVIGRTYRVKFTVSNYSAGTVRSSVGAYEFGAYHSANGTYEENITITNPSANSTVYIQGNVDFIGDIDNVEVHEITEDVTFDTSDLYRDCVAWYKMNEGSGTVMLDSTSNGNDGTIVNGDTSFFSTQRQYHFDYMGNILLNGGVEDWTSPTDLTGWIESLGGTGTINQESTEVYQGVNAIRLNIDAVNNTVASVFSAINLAADTTYKATITYKNSVAAKTAKMYFRDTTLTLYLNSDGTWGDVSTPFIEFDNTLNYVIFEVEFTTQSTGEYRFQLQNNVSASASIYYDNSKIQEKV